MTVLHKFVVLMALVVINTLAAVFLMKLGFDWINEGFGLHPIISFSLAPMILLLPILYVSWASRDIQEDVEELIEEHLIKQGPTEIFWIKETIVRHKPMYNLYMFEQGAEEAELLMDYRDKDMALQALWDLRLNGVNPVRKRLQS